MLLQSIVDQLDRELSRLYSLRSIVAALGNTPAAFATLEAQGLAVSEVQTKTEEPVAVVPVQRPRRRTVAARVFRRVVKQAKAPEPSALRHSVPLGPVVISAAQLALERGPRSGMQEVVERTPATAYTVLPDLEGQSRALASRWITGSAV